MSGKVCSIDGCGQVTLYTGLCRSHYNRSRDQAQRAATKAAIALLPEFRVEPPINDTLIGRSTHHVARHFALLHAFEGSR